MEDPIGTMKKIADITNSVILVDSHIHHSSPADEDIPSWWMLNDMDEKDSEGLLVGDEVLSIEKYLEFESKTKVDYNNLQNKFILSPQTERDLEFIKKYFPHPSQANFKEYKIGASSKFNLALIPNKKALYKLVRSVGFEDILEVVPHRFVNIPYKIKCRLSFFLL